MIKTATQMIVFTFKDSGAATGAEALAAALGSETCDMTGMDEKVRALVEWLR